MPDYSKHTGPKTTVWKDGPSGQVLVKSLEGLPYGTQASVYIPDLGEATFAGIQKAGSGSEETIVEVRYTLK